MRKAIVRDESFESVDDFVVRKKVVKSVRTILFYPHERPGRVGSVGGGFARGERGFGRVCDRLDLHELGIFHD